MEVIQKPVDELTPYARNPRINDHAVSRLAGAIKEFGFRVPILAKSDGTVIDGHLRLKAALQLGMTNVPVVIADDLTDTQIKAFRISINRMAELAEWDTELLRMELDDLQLEGFDLELTGFDGALLAGPEDIEDLAEFNTDVNISVQCRDLAELAEMQMRLGISGRRIKAQALIERMTGEDCDP